MPPLSPSKPSAKDVSVAQNLTHIRARIKLALENRVLEGKQPRLIAVSKGQPEERVREALMAGQLDFGENRVQEALARWAGIWNLESGTKNQGTARRDFSCLIPDSGFQIPILHLIGPLQTNKVKEAVALFDVIHTVDRLKLADALAAEMKKQGRALPCFIQVNTGEEPQKAGVAPRDAESLLAHCRKVGLNVVGLMCIPPAGEPPAPHFALLRKMADEMGLKELSMGMSGDFETALRFGATYLRIGTAIFGERKATR